MSTNLASAEILEYRKTLAEAVSFYRTSVLAAADDKTPQDWAVRQVGIAQASATMAQAMATLLTGRE